ncbi:MAG: hypothetical protein MZV70_37915 [Desulfobacterales bacterium]|nr:hypothetical protein [Desulfobacterales bacterium]
MSEHNDKCPDCRAEADAYERLVRETEAVKAEIRRAAASVDWDALPALIADRAAAELPKPVRFGRRAAVGLARSVPHDAGPGRSGRRPRRRRRGHVSSP